MVNEAKQPSKTPTKTSKNPEHFDPFASFSSEMSNLARSFFGDQGPLWNSSKFSREFPLSNGAKPGLMPAVDVTENETNYSIAVELPGMGPEDVELTIHDGMAKIKGDKKFEHEDDDEDIHIVERSYGSFQRSFRLPDGIDEAAIEAKFDKGVLRLLIPKSPEVAASKRKIEIKG